jgi:hypothetical protein
MGTLQLEPTVAIPAWDSFTRDLRIFQATLPELSTLKRLEQE